jgi:hypothetical protein
MWPKEEREEWMSRAQPGRRPAERKAEEREEAAADAADA